MITLRLASIILMVGLAILSCQTHHDHPHPHGHDHQHHENKQPTIDFDARLDSLGITLNTPGSPVANYVNIRQAGNILYLAGKGPSLPEGGYITGQIGNDLTVEEGYEAAKWAAIAQLSVLKDHLGDLNRVKQLLKVTGMVNAIPGFGDQPEVINGFSDTMVAVFGERGKHARAAVGMGSLPRNIAVEVDLIVEIY